MTKGEALKQVSTAALMLELSQPHDPGVTIEQFRKANEGIVRATALALDLGATRDELQRAGAFGADA